MFGFSARIASLHMSSPHITCVLITYNSARFLPTFFEGLCAQKNVEIELIIIDNASSDDSVILAEKLAEVNGKKLMSGRFKSVKIISNSENLGYSGAAEQGVRESDEEYILIANPDIVFEPEYVVRLVERMQQDKKIGAITGKLLKYDFAKFFDLQAKNQATLASGKTTVIDSAGLVMLKSRRCVDRGQGSEDRGQFDEPEEVFGVTGAAPVYRKSALSEITVGGHVFEPDFFMYKEDVDVSWRLRLLGWSCFYEPRAVAYHGRGTGAINRDGVIAVAQNRESLPKFTRHHSYRNERVMRLRNEFIGNALRDVARIAWRELLMVGWAVIHEPFLFKSMYEVFKKIPTTFKHRKELMKKIKISAREMRRWFT